MDKAHGSSTRPSPPEAFGPRYAIALPNAPIVLFEGELQLAFGTEKTTGGRGTIELSWLPFPAIRFRLSQEEHLPGAIHAQCVKLIAPALDMSCHVVITGVSMNVRCTYEGFLDESVVVGDFTSCQQLWFHLPNFLSVIGEVIRYGDGSEKTGRLHFHSSNLDIAVDTVQNAQDLIQELTVQSGFALTSVGVVQLTDGNLLDPAQTTDILSALHYFFSFLRGFWCGPILELGIMNGNVAWRRWQHPKVTPWKYVEQWFPYAHYHHSLSEINNVFSGFMAKWTDDLWQTPIRVSIHWYIESNIGVGGIEGAIILAQTALELLSWVYLVEDLKTAKMSSGSFNSKHADCKIRSLLNELCIPTEIPELLHNLRIEASLLEVADGPAVITKLRNCIVHPRKSKRDAALQVPVSARMEAHALELWYIEMVLLRLLGYQGEYYQRFQRGTLEDAITKVPWL